MFIDNIELSNLSQNNLVQLLSNQLLQQQQKASASASDSNSQVVINLEDVLNVILNAASIVTSQSNLPTVDVNNNNSKPAASVTQQQQNEQDFQSTVANSSIAEMSTTPSFFTNNNDDIISQSTINSYTNLDNDMELSSFDEITKMSLLNSNDFCNQYKKRIQQAKERLVQKKFHEEQELIKQQELKDLKNIKKTRKRHSSSITNILSDESQKKKPNTMNDQVLSKISNSDDLEKALANKSNNELIKMFLINDLNNEQNLNKKEPNKFQLILSALELNEELVANSNGTGNNNVTKANDEEQINNANDPLLNSYPPKKRHRMQQQHQDQQQLIQQQLLNNNSAEKSPVSVVDEQCSNESNLYNNNNNINISHNENLTKNESAEKNQETSIQMIQKISSECEHPVSIVKKEEGLLKIAINELNNESQSQKQYHEILKNDSSANNISSNSSSTSLSPSSSPSVFMDSVSSTSSLNLVNNLSRVDFNQSKVSLNFNQHKKYNS